MTSSFERTLYPQLRPSESGTVRPPGANAAPKRFVAREALGPVASWSPSQTFGRPPADNPVSAPAAPAAPDPQPLIDAARQAAYQEGYRDGLAALEAFRQSHAAQVTGQLGELLCSFGAQFDALEVQMAEVLAQTARDLARQVVRHELSVQPELVASVAHEAVTSLLLSARHVTLRVHPDDHDLVLQGLGDELERRGARLIDDASVSRGGCIVESDVGIVNARIENRWSRASAALADEQAWNTP